MKFDEFIGVYNAVFELKHKGKKLPSKLAIQMYFESVKEIDIDTFKLACIRTIRKSKWMPDPAEIWEIVNEIKRPVPPPAVEVMKQLGKD